jgi:hypothetical protein
LIIELSVERTRTGQNENEQGLNAEKFYRKTKAGFFILLRKKYL